VIFLQYAAAQTRPTVTKDICNVTEMTEFLDSDEDDCIEFNCWLDNYDTNKKNKQHHIEVINDVLDSISTLYPFEQDGVSVGTKGRLRFTPKPSCSRDKWEPDVYKVLEEIIARNTQTQNNAGGAKHLCVVKKGPKKGDWQECDWTCQVTTKNHGGNWCLLSSARCCHLYPHDDGTFCKDKNENAYCLS